MICKQCGALLKPTDKFCEYCDSANPDCVHYEYTANPKKVRFTAEITVPYYMLDSRDAHEDFKHSCRSLEVQQKLAQKLAHKIYPLLPVKYKENIEDGSVTFVTSIDVDRNSLFLD